MTAQITEQVQTIIADAQTLAPTLVDKVKTQSLNLKELLLVDVLYLGVFGLVALLLPQVAIIPYGGDNLYAGDWARSAAVAQLFVAFVAATIRRWKSGVPQDEVIFALMAFFGLDAVANLMTVMYGSLSIICFANAVVCGGLAFFHFKHSPLQKKAE